MENIEFFTLTGEDGNEYHFMYVDEIELNGTKYWICDEAFPEENAEEIVLGDSVAFKVIQDGEEFFLDSIEDEKEYEAVSKAWEEAEKEIEIDEDADFELKEKE